MSASTNAAGLRPIPVTMLSGFLGAGKTTLLKYVLENSPSKIACMVNDLASVNIDSKLVRNSISRSDETPTAQKAALADMVELQNGCACCSAADELFPAFAELVQIGDQSGTPFERIILENSGVAEPQNIRDSFNDAIAMGHPITQRIELEGLITVVDSVTFVADYGSIAPMSLRPDLGDGVANARPVVDLLVEQIECADVVVLNKADALEPEKMERLKPIIASLNPLAHVVTVSWGKVPMELIGRVGIASRMNIEAQHRTSVLAAARAESGQGDAHNDNSQDQQGHGHDQQAHDHAHGHDHGHEHAHGHDHGHEHAHGHDHHGHDHAHGHDHHGHDHHGHGHGHEHHGHDHHGHDHSRNMTPAKKFGISSFVYTRRRPFHPIRLRQLVLCWLPATYNSALDGEQPQVGDSPIKRVLRSKGFVWLANGHISAFYWSHAGQHFELREEGDWWVGVAPEFFPPDPRQKLTIYNDFDEHGKYGDRRQEIVFIGANMQQDQIEAQLDQALLTDAEMEQYNQNWAGAPDPVHPDMPYFKELAKQTSAPARTGSHAGSQTGSRAGSSS